MKRVLFVDDEAALLDGIKKALRPFRDAWDIEVATSGAAAIERLKAQTYDAIITDVRMAHVDGEAVLRAAVELQPQSLRVVLSGQVNLSNGTALATLAHTFISKPCAARDILDVLVARCGSVDALTSDSLRAMIARLGQLPVAPTTFLRLNSLLAHPKATVSEIVEVIEQNPLVAASVLRLVGSAFFGLPRKVTTLRDAVVMLGLEAVRRLVLMAEVFQEKDTVGVVEHLEAGAAARLRVVRGLAVDVSAATAFASEAALVADVGAYVMALRLPEYAAIWIESRRGERGLADLERDAFGASHAEVGAALLGLWSLPAPLLNAVAHHHQLPALPTLDTHTLVALACLVEDFDTATGHRRAFLEAEIERITSALHVDAAVLRSLSVAPSLAA